MCFGSITNPIFTRPGFGRDDNSSTMGFCFSWWKITGCRCISTWSWRCCVFVCIVPCGLESQLIGCGTGCYQAMMIGIERIGTIATVHHFVLQCLHVECSLFKQGCNVLKGFMHLCENRIPFRKGRSNAIVDDASDAVGQCFVDGHSYSIKGYWAWSVQWNHRHLNCTMIGWIHSQYRIFPNKLGKRIAQGGVYNIYAVPATGSKVHINDNLDKPRNPTKLSTIDSTRYGGPDLSSR